MWLALLPLGHAGDQLATLVDALGTSVHQAGSCSSLTLWSEVFEDADPIGNAVGAPSDWLGVDGDAPIRTAVIGRDGDRYVEVGLADVEAFEAFVPRLFPGAIRSDGVYRLRDGRVARVDLTEDRARITTTGRARGGLVGQLPSHTVRAVAAAVDEDRCAFVRSVMPLAVAFDTGDAVEVVVPPPPIHDVTTAETGPPGLRTATKPVAVVRANVDIEELLAVEPPPGALGEGRLSDAFGVDGVGVEPGAELAIWISEQVVVRAPVGSAFKARQVLRRARKQGEVDDGLMLAPTERGPIWMARDGDAVILSNNPALVRDALDVGNPLALEGHIAPGAPGLVGIVDPPPGLLHGMGITVIDSAFLFSVAVEDDVARAQVTSAGLGLAAADEFWPAAPADPIGSPPSTEALSVLMNIATAEEAFFVEEGRYVGYAGGPRELDQLDEVAVAWDGIPSLGVGAMDTACRYEVQLVGEAYSARSICDEDADGKHAITVMGPGGRPSRVTPDDVR